MRVSEFSTPKFKTDSGWETVKKSLVEMVSKGEDIEKVAEYIPDCYLEGIDLSVENSTNEAFKRLNLLRAQRRAKVKALEMILCNPDLDMFGTFTYAEDKSVDRLDYDSCYKVLKPWLSNRVERRGLKYVAVAEKQKKGGIHFHLLANKSALALAPARSPYTGKALTHSGKPLFNVSDWRHGFTSAEDISGEDAQTKVAKYIFKYMTKNQQKIGGRYLLHGGDMAQPVYAYADSAEEFLTEEPKFTKSVEIGENISYKEWSFI